MRRHARLPAIFAIALTALAGFAALRAGGIRSLSPESANVADLERTITDGHASAETWQNYGDALRLAQRPQHAIEAYLRALALQPDRREARLAAAITLAQANAPARTFDPCFAFLNDSLIHDAKLTVDLLERQELAPLRTDPRYEPLLQNARAQAAD